MKREKEKEKEKERKGKERKGKEKESVNILEGMHAKVHLQKYEGRPHTVSQDEIDRTNHLIFKP